MNGLRHWRGRLGVGALVMALAATASPRVHADDPFRAGVRRYQEGDLPGAAAAFALAYERSHDFRLLYNLAQVQEELRDDAQALRSLELYLSRGGASIAAERRAEVEHTRAELERRTARVRVATNVAAARLWIDGAPAGSLPSDATWLNPGVHQLLVAREGHAPALQTLVLLPGERRLIELPLALAPRAPVAARSEPATAEPAERTLLWLGMGATGASAALAVGFALLTRDADADLERELERYPADPAALDAARSRVSTLATVTDACVATSALAAGLSLYLALSSAQRDGAPLGNLGLGLAPGSARMSFDGAF